MKNKKLGITALVILLVGFESPVDASFSSRLKAVAATVAHSARVAKAHTQKVVNSKPVQLASRYGLPLSLAGVVALEADLHAITMAKIKEFERSPIEGKAIIPAHQTIDDIAWYEDMQKLPFSVKQRIVAVINHCGIQDKLVFRMIDNNNQLPGAMIGELEGPSGDKVFMISFDKSTVEVLHGKALSLRRSDGSLYEASFGSHHGISILFHELGHAYQDLFAKTERVENSMMSRADKQFDCVKAGFLVSGARLLKNPKTGIGALLLSFGLAACLIVDRLFLQASMSQGFEKSADIFACQVADDEGLYFFKERLEKAIDFLDNTGSGTKDSLMQIFSTHPTYSSRIAMLEAEIARRELARAKQGFTMTV